MLSDRRLREYTFKKCLNHSGSSLQETAEPGNPLKRFGGLTSIFEDLVANRPEKEELVSRNILKGENVAGAIQAAQEHLKIKFLEVGSC